MYQRKAKQKAPKEDRRYDIVLIHFQHDDGKVYDEVYECFPNSKIEQYPLMEGPYGEPNSNAIRLIDANGNSHTKHFDRARFHEVF